MKENYGNLDTLKELGKTKTLPFTKEQLQDNNLKNIDGESYNDVITRNIADVSRDYNAHTRIGDQHFTSFEFVKTQQE